MYRPMVITGSKKGAKGCFAAAEGVGQRVVSWLGETMMGGFLSKLHQMLTMPARLFDCLEQPLTLAVPDLLNHKIKNTWIGYSGFEVHSIVYQLSYALLQMGISAGDGSVEGRSKVAILSGSRHEWLLVDLAVQQTGAVLVSLCPNISSSDLALIQQETGVQLLFAEGREAFRKVKKIAATRPTPKQVLT